jgi:hypothetical protein
MPPRHRHRDGHKGDATAPFSLYWPALRDCTCMNVQGAVEQRNGNWATITRQLSFTRRGLFDLLDDAPDPSKHRKQPSLVPDALPEELALSEIGIAPFSCRFVLLNPYCLEIACNRGEGQQPCMSLPAPQHNPCCFIRFTLAACPLSSFRSC